MAQQVNRLGGKYAVCRVNGLLVAHLTDWEVTITNNFQDATAHNDLWVIPVIDRIEWSGRCSGFMTEASRVSFLSLWATPAVLPVAPYVETPSVVFTGYNDHLSLANSKRLFEAEAYATTTTIRLPNGMATQEINLRSIGSPTYIGNSVN